MDIIDSVKGLSAGDTITITVNNTELEGYAFDGRIKIIALIFALALLFVYFGNLSHFV